MKDLELNKLAAAVLVAGLIALIVGKVTDVLYHPGDTKERGYQIAGAETASSGESAGAAPAAFDPKEVLKMIGSADAKAGEASAKKCAACHDFTKGGPNKVGPGLWGIIGHPKGGHAGFAYSDAMKAKGGNWDFESLATFIHDPKGFVPGTKMAFAGVKKPSELANILAYLRSLSDSPVPAPAGQ